MPTANILVVASRTLKNIMVDNSLGLDNVMKKLYEKLVIPDLLFLHIDITYDKTLI